MANVIIIGGMAAGCKAAARLRRLKPDWQITIIERKGFLSYGTCGMPFYASGDIDDFFDLAKTQWGVLRDATFFKEVKNIDVMLNTSVTRIDPANNSIECLKLDSGEGFQLQYDYLVIATGAKPSKPSFIDINSDRISYFHNPIDAKIFREKAQKGEIASAIIVGGGYIGCELAEALVSLWGIETTIVESENRLLPRSFDNSISGLLEQTFINNDISLYTGKKIEILKIEEESIIASLSDGTELSADYIFICTGVIPETKLAADAGIEIGELGGILVDDYLRTNINNIYAGGDCIEIKHIVHSGNCLMPLGSLANRQGRTIADNIAGFPHQFKAAGGAVSLKVFGLTLASCGITLDDALSSGMHAGTVIGSWFDRPDYMPEHKTLFGQLVYEASSLKILGLQLAGAGELTRYIDSFSVFLHNSATVFELLEHEHAYTPTHSSPLNPLNFLAAMAIEQENSGIKCIAPFDFNESEFDGYLIDLREPEESSKDVFSENAMNIPLGELRANIDEFDKNKEMILFCQKGPRAYEAAKLFKHKGFNFVYYLGGGVQLNNKILDSDN